MKFFPRIVLLLAVATFALPRLPAQTSGIQRVWAVDDGERIKKTATNHPLATSSDNKVWNGSSISLFGAGNEVIAFQLILQGKSSGATNVNVRLDSLHKSTTPKFTIKNTGGIGDPFNYVGKRIELFVQHYMNVTARSNAPSLWWSAARPVPDADFLGLLPEQLVPFEAAAGPKTNGQGGAPFSVTAGQNQGVWVDIYIPREAPEGTYTGTVRVTEGGVERYAIPLTLQVYPFVLSDTTHLRNMFHIASPGITDRHAVGKGTGQYWTLMKRYYAMGHRHRADFTDGRVNLSTFSANLGPLYTGAYYQPANGYDGPGRGVGNRVYSVGTYDQPRTATGTDNGSVSGFTYSSDLATFRSTWQSVSTQWMQWFQANAPGVLVFKYMADEPGLTDTSIFADMRRKAGWLKSNSGVGRLMKTLSTTNVRPDLRGTIDIWMGTGQSGYINGGVNPFPAGYVVDSAHAVRSRGQMAGFYNGTAPAFGTHVIDAPATHMRVNPWIAWKYNTDIYFLWYVNHWGDESGEPIDPWAADRRNIRWGDGSLVYAGQNKNSTLGNDRGIAGPIAGIRLKNWRRGAQDFEYLLLAQQLGFDVSGLVNGVVQAAFDDVNQAEPAQHKSRGWEFENYRRQLAELIASASSPLPYGGLTVTPTELTDGPGPVTLQWNSTHATTASIDRGIGAVPVNGSRTVTVDSTTTFTLTLTNAEGSRSYQARIVVRRIPSGSFNAAPDTLPAGGGTATLNWTSTGATTASIAPGIGAVAVNGSRAVTVSELTTYTLTLTSTDGARVLQKRIFVRTPPTGTLTVSPDSIDAEGGEVTLRWTSRNALTARLDHGIGAVDPIDSLGIFLTIPTTFSLTLQNPFGSTVSTVTVYQRPFQPKFVTIPPESLVAKDPVTGRIQKPVRRGRDLFPNWINLLSELVVQGGFQPNATESDAAGGLVIGVSSMNEVGPNRYRPNPDSASVKTWVRLSKWNFGKAAGSSYKAILSSLEGREGPHTGTPRGSTPPVRREKAGAGRC